MRWWGPVPTGVDDTRRRLAGRPSRPPALGHHVAELQPGVDAGEVEQAPDPALQGARRDPQVPGDGLVRQARQEHGEQRDVVAVGADYYSQPV